MESQEVLGGDILQECAHSLPIPSEGRTGVRCLSGLGQGVQPQGDPSPTGRGKQSPGLRWAWAAGDLGTGRWALNTCRNAGRWGLARLHTLGSCWGLQETGGHLHSHPGRNGISVSHLDLRIFTQSKTPAGSFKWRGDLPLTVKGLVSQLHFGYTHLLIHWFYADIYWTQVPRGECCYENRKTHQSETALNVHSHRRLIHKLDKLRRWNWFGSLWKAD